MQRRTRRTFLRGRLTLGAAGSAAPWLSGCGPSATAQSAAPSGGGAAPVSGGKIRIGFIPLTDCASVVRQGQARRDGARNYTTLTGYVGYAIGGNVVDRIYPGSSNGILAYFEATQKF